MPPSSVQFAMNDESSRRRDSLDGTTPAKGATSIKPIPSTLEVSSNADVVEIYDPKVSNGVKSPDENADALPLLDVVREPVPKKSLREAPKSWEEYIHVMEDTLLRREARRKSAPTKRSRRVKSDDDKDSSKSKTEDSSSTSSAESDDNELSLTCISIPKMRYVTWTEWRKGQGRKASAVHNAIDILSEEFSMLSSNADSTETNLIEAVLNKSHGGSDLNNTLQNRRELPERIRINSRRLLCVLDYDLCDGRLNYWVGNPLHLLRPFKVLDYHERGIRQRLSEFESARKQMCPRTKEEYKTMLLDDPVPDEAESRFRDVTKMALSELTATINDIRLLISFIDQTIKPVQTMLQKNARTVYYSELWYIFRPGSLVFVRDKNVPQKVWKVIQRTGGRRYMTRPEHITRGSFEDKFTAFVLDCYHLNYDGIVFPPTFHQFEIDHYDGLQSMASLPVLPFEVAVKENLVNREDLMRRGQQFLDYTKVSHCYYSGRSQDRAPDGNRLTVDKVWPRANITLNSEIVESQVMIDFEQAFKINPAWLPRGDMLQPYKMDPNENDTISREKNKDNYDKDDVWDLRVTDELMDDESEKWQEWKKRGIHPSGEDLLLLPDRVFAFCFRSRKWACLQIGADSKGQEQLRELKPKLDAWNDLELPEGHKNIVQSLIQSHFDKDKSQKVEFDLVRDKGKGVIILLHGVPGVGKTSTAECVAESTNKPLLPIACGDLGLTPKDVEANLETAFQLAQAWDCVMLLDDADIFLEKRTTGDIERNAIVSVFLRVLEYYSGILFLTTNRVGAFDEAFKSRIHMSLYYPPLSWLQTQRIWESQIRRITEQTNSIDGDIVELLQYAKTLYHDQENKKELGPVWNGRQIRNAFQSAIALAKFNTILGQHVKVKKEHFERVAEVSHHFNNYVWRVKKGHTDSDLASSNMSRTDDYDPSSLSKVLQQPVHPSASPQSNFGQTHLQVSSPGIMQNFAVPQQQMYHMNGSLPMQSQQYMNTQAYPSQLPQGYASNLQLQSQSPQQQQFYQPGVITNNLVGNMMQQPQQQERVAQGQQSAFLAGSPPPMQQSLPPASNVQGSNMQGASMQDNVATQHSAQTQQFAQTQHSVQTQHYR